MDIGAQIKARRTAQQFTLSDLADRSGVSKAMLCDVEANRKNPTIRILDQIAIGLGCTISDLIEVEPSPRFEPIRKGEHQTLIDPDSGIERRVLAPPLVRRGINVVQYVFPPGASIDFPAERPGIIEHITITRGRIQLTFGGQAIELSVGDSITYQGEQDHTFLCLSEEPGEFVLVMDATQPGKPTTL